MYTFEQDGFMSQQLDNTELLQKLADEHDYEIEFHAATSKEGVVQPEVLYVNDMRVACFELLGNGMLRLHYSVGTNATQRFAGVLEVENRLQITNES